MEPSKEGHTNVSFIYPICCIYQCVAVLPRPDLGMSIFVYTERTAVASASAIQPPLRALITHFTTSSTLKGQHQRRSVTVSSHSRRAWKMDDNPGVFRRYPYPYPHPGVRVSTGAGSGFWKTQGYVDPRAGNLTK